MSAHDGVEKQPRLLLVDDDATIRVMARDRLEGAGFAVLEAADGREALARFEAERPHLVLLDLQLPELDGLSVCEAIRQQPGASHVPVLVLTSLHDVEWVRRAFEAGATDFVPKPVDWLVVTERVRYMLRAAATLTSFARSETRLDRAQRIARLGNWEWDLESTSLRCSRQLRRILGFPEQGDPISRESFLARVHPQDRRLVSHAFERSVRELEPFGVDHRVVLPDGTERIVHTQAEVVGGEAGETLELAGTVQDITERKQAEKRLRFLAFHDELTHLGNREFFRARLRQALAQARRHGRSVAILFLDLDHFKRINDTLGHSVGDQLLQRVAERLRNCTREGDFVSRSHDEDGDATVSRFGGDEFIVMLAEIGEPEDAARVARRVLEVLSQPFRLQQHEVVIGASVGIAVFPHDGDDVETMLRNADAAMYHAKERGRNNFQFYESSMNTVAMRRLELEGELRKAVERQQLHVHYQPKLDLRSGHISGVEALLRWTHPALGAVSPAEFVPVAEQGGLILSIGEFVLRAACNQARFWQDAGLPPVRVSVNLSAHQFAAEGLVATVRRVLTETGLDPRWLELEITESVLMENERLAVAAMEEMQGIGIVVSLDDFGTGYSSLSYLKRFRVNAVKIDRCFVRDIASDPEDAAIIGAIISIARALRMKVIAEGVETEAQRDFLIERGCDEMQGYLYSRPVAPEVCAELLRSNSARETEPAGGEGR